MDYDNTLCSVSGRPYTPQKREHKAHPPINEEDLIKKRALLDPLEYDDEKRALLDPFDVHAIETPEQIMSRITFKGSPQLQFRLKALVLEWTCNCGTNRD